MKFIQIFASAALACASLSAPAAFANDSEAETSLGGLTLKQSEDISMDSEELFVSAGKVTVKYRFTNHSDKDVTTLVAFPLPTQPDAKAEFEGEIFYPDWTELQFETSADGKPLELQLNEQVTVDGKDVSARLKELRWPARWFNDLEFLDGLQNTDPAKLRGYMDEGLLTASEGGWGWLPRWQVAAQITREQTFPAGKTIAVEHSYVPLAGGSVGGALSKSVRDSDPEILAHYRENYCVDDSFLKGFDRKVAAKGENGGMYGETWIGYILSSGANWKGPIKDFRLVIDKGSTDNLVSFCMDGVKKISPTQFEVRKTNFEPKDDLDILIVEWFKPSE